MYTFNTANHKTTGYSLFFLLLVHPPHWILSFTIHDNSSIAETSRHAEDALRIAHAHVCGLHEKAPKHAMIISSNTLPMFLVTSCGCEHQYVNVACVKSYLRTMPDCCSSLIVLAKLTTNLHSLLQVASTHQRLR